MADLFKLTLNEKEFAVEVSTGVLSDIVDVFSKINDYNTWKRIMGETLYTTMEEQEVVENGVTVTKEVPVVDQDALDAYATKERYFATTLRDIVLEKYSNFKRQEALAAANAQVETVINSVKNAVVTKL